MTKEKKLGMESAFPYEYENRDGTRQPLPGMSKRFYAACAAMQGLLANPNPDLFRLNQAQIAEMAYEFADKLLKQEEL